MQLIENKDLGKTVTGKNALGFTIKGTLAKVTQFDDGTFTYYIKGEQSGKLNRVKKITFVK